MWSCNIGNYLIKCQNERHIIIKVDLCINPLYENENWLGGRILSLLTYWYIALQNNSHKCFTAKRKKGIRSVVCYNLLIFLWIGATYAFFQSLGNIFSLKQFLKMVVHGPFIESLNSFNIRTLVMSLSFLGSSFLIILLTCWKEKSIDVKTESAWVVNLFGKWLLLTRGVHCLVKYEFALILDLNLLLWYIGGIQDIFLPFSNIFRRDQYFLGLRLLSDYLRDIFS